MSDLLVPEVHTQINSYLEHPHTVGLSKETRKAYKCVLQGQLLEFCEKSQITTLDTSFENKMENFVSYLLGHGADPYTIQHYLTITKFFMKKVVH